MSRVLVWAVTLLLLLAAFWLVLPLFGGGAWAAVDLLARVLP